MFYRLIKFGVSSVFMLALVGCDGPGETKHSNRSDSPEQDQRIEDKDNKPEPMEPPRYSTAMERHTPLGTITGALIPLQNPTKDESAGFASVLDYAEATQSYSLLIWHNGALRLERYFNDHTSGLRSESASMHKSVVALLVAAAIDDGLVPSADTPAWHYIDEWTEDGPRASISVRDLLTMSSGLAPLSFEGGAQSAAAKYVYDGTNARANTLGQPLQHEPGTRFHYMGVSTQLLINVLEAATGQPYVKYLSERLWQQIGADDAYVWYNEDDGYPRGYTALMARARDWLRLGLLLKDRGKFGDNQIISEGMVEAAITGSSANPNYAWQMWRGNTHEPVRYYNDDKTGLAVKASEPYLASDMIYFDGFGGQRVYVSRSEDLVIVRLGDMQFDWDDAELPNRVIRALRDQNK